MSQNLEQVADQSASDSKRSRIADRAFGNQSVSKIGRTAALITVVVAVVGVVLLVRQIGVVNYKSDLTLNEVSESLVQNGDGSCQWIVDFQLANRSDITATITSGTLYLRQANTARDLIPHGTDSSLVGMVLAPGNTTPGRITVEMPSCPSSADQVSHDPLFVSYHDGSARAGLSVIEF